MAYLVIKVFIILTYFSLVKGKVVEGVIETETSRERDVWRYMARFCFVSGGKFEFDFEYPEKYETQSINLYYDEPDKWEKVYGSNIKCVNKTSLPYINRTAGHQIRLQPSSLECELTDDDEIKCKNSRTFSSARQRWWYMALSRCEPDRVRNEVKGMKLKYKLVMTNGDGLFYKHFSADEFYILQIDITFLMITLVLLLITAVFTLKLMKKRLLHTTFKMFTASLVFHLVYLFLMCCMWGAFANDGIERYGLKTFGRLWEVMSDITFILMLILMGKGYTITRGRLRKASWVKIVIFTCCYVLAYTLLFLIEAELFDPAQVLYIYDSPAGYGLLVLRILAYIWFLYANIFTLKHYPEKRKFYLPFLIFFTVWFLATPVVVLIAAFAMADWVRATVVNAIEVFIVLCGQVFFLVLTAPSSANKNFPYHVKTNKIDFINDAPHHSDNHNAISDSEDEEPSRNSRPLNVPRYSQDLPRASAPSYTTSNTAPNFLDLFTTSNTHSENPRPMKPLSPPPVYSVSQQMARGSPPPTYSERPDSAKDDSEGSNSGRGRFDNDENPFITQRG